MESANTITSTDFVNLLGMSDSALPEICLRRIKQSNFSYSSLTNQAREAHVLAVLKRLNQPGILRDATTNLEAFEKGWQENLDLCQALGLTRANLRPKYVRPYQCIRYQDDYICPADPYLSDNLLGLAVHYSFSQYLKDCPSVTEFGCGTGQYIYDLAQLYPDKALIGTDWTETSGKILNLMAANGLKVSARKFDMLCPDLSFALPKNSGVVTIGAMEQIGANFGPFLEYLLIQNPAIVIHHEPIEEFYSHDTLAGCLGRLWHKSRNYLAGYLTALQQLEKNGRIKILNWHHLNFGDPFHDSGSRIVWRPA